MDFANPMVWIVAGLVVLGLVIVLLAPRFSAKARLDRRRRKSNARIVSKEKRPSVKFSVRSRDKK